MKKIVTILLLVLLMVTLVSCGKKQSASPIEPNLPVEPTEPSTPVTPTDPEEPKEPEKPIDPEEPQEPSTPEIKVYKEHFEDFDGRNSSEYQDYTYESQSGLIWELYWGRIDLLLEGRAVSFKGRHRPDGFYGGMETSIEDGLSYVSFDAKLPYAEKGHDVQIDIYINETKVKRFEIPFKDITNVYTFVMPDLNYRGKTNFEIGIESGKVVTIDNIELRSNPKVDEVNALILHEDFENQSFEYDLIETRRDFGGISFMMKEVQTKEMHKEKEIPFLTQKQGDKVSRFRGAGKDFIGTPDAYMYTEHALSFVSMVSFDAKYFSPYNEFAEMHVYVMEKDSDTWIHAQSIALTLAYETYEIKINRHDVKVKFEVLYSSVNVDNIKIFK